MFSTGSELPKPPLPVRQDGKFYSRLHPIKDSSSLACPSFRVYYGVASGAVPFLWESQPGIPKHSYSSNTLLQPLSPPPSYFSSPKNMSSKKNTSNKFRFKLIFRRKKFCRPFPFPSPSFSSPVSSAASLPSIAGPAGASRCCSRRPVVKCFSCFWNNVELA